VDLLTNEWLFWLAVLLLGLGIGFILGRNNNTHPPQQQNLQQQLMETQTQLTTYKEQVNEHFANTATLINSLSENYRQIHQHLASGAHLLCDDPDTARDITHASDASFVSQDIPENFDEQQLAMVTAPMDYAPRKTANHPNTLAEDYGLQHSGESSYDISKHQARS
jgi:hypothetical protein